MTHVVRSKKIKMNAIKGSSKNYVYFSQSDELYQVPRINKYLSQLYSESNVKGAALGWIESQIKLF